MLILSDLFPLFGVIGGAQICAYNLGRALAQQGCEVSVLTTSSEETFLSSEGFEVHTVVYKESAIPMYRDFKRWELTAYKFMRKLVKMKPHQFDIIHANDPISAYAVYLARKVGLDLPSVVTIRDYWPVCPHRTADCLSDNLSCNCNVAKLAICTYRSSEHSKVTTVIGTIPYVTYKSISRYFVNRSIECFDSVACVSNFVRTVMLKNTNLNEDVVVTIHDATFVSGFNSNANIERKKQILFVGKISPIKGLQYMIRAIPSVIKDHPEYKFVIVGDAPYRKNIEELVNRLNVRKYVTFKGLLPRSKVCNQYLQSEIVVFPSIWQEPFGLISIEAMAAGKPLVATRVGGIPEVVRNGETGILVNSRNHKEIAEAIDFLIENSETAKEMGAHGKRIAEQKYSLNRMANEYLDLYEAIING